jgi:hypothetical protein
MKGDKQNGVGLESLFFVALPRISTGTAFDIVAPRF